MRHTKVPAPLRNGGFLRLIRAWAYLKPLLQVTAGREVKTARRKEVWLNVSFILHSVRRRVPGPSIPANVCART